MRGNLFKKMGEYLKVGFQMRLNQVRVPVNRMVNWFLNRQSLPGLWRASRQISGLTQSAARQIHIDPESLRVNGSQIKEPLLTQPLVEQGISTIHLNDPLSARQFRKVMRTVAGGFLAEDETFFYAGLNIHKSGENLFIDPFNPAGQQRDLCRLRLENVTDHLTGLYARHHFEKILQEKILESDRNPQVTVTLAFFDLNNFKPINDDLGYDMGNQVLRTFASVLKKEVFKRDGWDYCFRWGGDEFAVITFTHGFNQLRTRMDILKRGLDEACQAGRQKNPKFPEKITFSAGLGFHSSRNRGETPERFFERVEAVYKEAKAASKNESAEKISGNAALINFITGSKRKYRSEGGSLVVSGTMIEEERDLLKSRCCDTARDQEAIDRLFEKSQNRTAGETVVLMEEIKAV